VSTGEPADIERLRAALAASVTGKGGPPVDAGQIFDALHGEVAPEQRQAVVDAIVSDAEAAEAWRLAMELAPTPVAASEAAAQPPAASTWRWLGLAAALVLAVGLAWQVLAPWRQVEPPVYRDIDGRAIVSRLPEGTLLSRDSPVLRWSALDGARYRIRLFTAELQPLAVARDLSAPEYTIPPDVLGRLPAGALVLWQIEADVPGAATVLSPTFTARLQ
jgi:hypothetical protein